MIERRPVHELLLVALALSVAGMASPASAYISNRLWFQSERARLDHTQAPRSPSASLQGSSQPYKVTRSGVPLKVRWYYALEQTCASKGRTSVNLVSAPQGGQVYTRSAMEFPNFPTTNTRSVCNARRVAATDVMYRPRADFVGADRFTVEVVFPSGSARRDTYVVSVR